MLGTAFNGRRLWPLHVRCCRKLSRSVSSSDELLLAFETVEKYTGISLHDVVLLEKEALLCRFPKSAPNKNEGRKNPNFAQSRV